MSDTEIVRLCAEAMGINPLDMPYCEQCDEYAPSYDPLQNKAQCFALVERFPIECYTAYRDYCDSVLMGEKADLCKAACECVARMQLAKNK